jgi:NADPH:quinone reductase
VTVDDRAAVPGPGQLLVQVRAAGLNRADLLDQRLPASPPSGRELAGDVLAVGEGVQGWSAGDRVMSSGPGFAAQAVVEARHAMPIPDSLSWEEAGALPIALMTMHDALVTNGAMAAGARVLVHAATSGVGVTGVQLASMLGASMVFATSRSAAKLDVLASFLGEPITSVLHAIDTSSLAFESEATDIGVVVDNVGATVLAGNIAAAAIGGRIVQVGRLGGRRAEIDLDELARKRIALIGVTFRTRSDEEIAEVVRRALADVGHRLGELAPRIERTYPLDDLTRAFRDLAANEHVGKLVVVP